MIGAERTKYFETMTMIHPREIRVTGFTLIEIMVVVAIIAILAGIALPAYDDYVIKSRITHAVSGLSTKHTQMEQCYQDNRTYFRAAGADPVVEPEINCAVCANDTTSSPHFHFSCTATATAYTLTATGQGKMAAFVYTVTQANVKTTAITSGPSGWSAHSPNNCWVLGKGGAC